MREFWQGVVATGAHPQDIVLLQQRPNLYIDWNLNEAQHNAGNPPPPNVLHVGLHPQPFIGNIADPLIFILHGNPGFSIRDYSDEFENPTHAAACIQNLQNADLGFFPLGNASLGTGAADYWLNAFSGAITALANSRNISIDDSRDIIRRNVGLIESCAYHSNITPGRWTDDLPSSRLAREYVCEVVLPRAKRGDSLVFIWRRVGRDDYWRRGDTHPNIMVRASRAAQSRNLLRSEQAAIVNFLDAHVY